MLFSQQLSEEELKHVTYYSYFPVLIDEANDRVKLGFSDLAAAYPLEFSIKSKTVQKGTLNFYNKVFHANFELGKALPDGIVSGLDAQPHHRKAIIINLLDNCFGHSFLKLLNVRNAYEQYGKDHDLIIITHKALAHFLPDKEAIKTVSLKLGFAKAQQAYDLTPLYNTIKAQYDHTELYVLNNYQQFDSKAAVIDFFRFTDQPPADQHRVTFYYRKDYFRTWRGTNQSKSIAQFLKSMQPFFAPETIMTVVGDKDGTRFPAWIDDQRTDQFGPAVDYNYNRIFMQSEIVVGLVGSNMLMPSMFSRMVVHLVPRDKSSITADEILNYRDQNMHSALENNFLHGGPLCNDLTPQLLLEKVVILYLKFIERKFKFAFYDQVRQGETGGQAAFLGQNFPFFNQTEAHKLKTGVSQKVNARLFFNYRFVRLFRKLRLLS